MEEAGVPGGGAPASFLSDGLAMNGIWFSGHQGWTKGGAHAIPSHPRVANLPPGSRWVQFPVSTSLTLPLDRSRWQQHCVQRLPWSYLATRQKY